MQNNISNELFQYLVGKNFDVKTLTSTGNEITDPEEAKMFSFDFVADGKNYGPVVILLTEADTKQMEIYFSDPTGKTMGRDSNGEWFDFLQHLKRFAQSHLYGTKVMDITKLKFSMQGQAAIKEGLFEGYYGTKKTSYSPMGKAKIIIKHSKPVVEGGRRYYNISSLFIENADGERFKLPFKRLMGARAMAQHCTEGGYPYDPFGQHITQIVKEIDTLSGFVRRTKTFEEDEDASQYVMAGREHLQALRKELKSLSNRRGYSLRKESFDPAAITPEEQSVEEIRALFTEKTLNDKIDEALPILARIAGSIGTQSDEGEMQEVKEFSNWADDVTEGTWALPSAETLEDLREFFTTEQPVGIDAMDATDKLYNILGDDDLFDDLGELADKDPQADARPVVQAWLKREMPHLLPQITTTQTEGLPGELDADDQHQLNASANSIIDKDIKEDASTGGVDQLSVELRNAIADDLVSVYDLLNDSIGFKPGEDEMAILQNAYHAIEQQQPNADYDEICDAITADIEASLQTAETAKPIPVTESLDSLLSLTNSLLAK